MCNLYSMTKARDAIRDLSDIKLDSTGKAAPSRKTRPALNMESLKAGFQWTAVASLRYSSRTDGTFRSARI